MNKFNELQHEENIYEKVKYVGKSNKLHTYGEKYRVLYHDRRQVSVTTNFPDLSSDLLDPKDFSKPFSLPEFNSKFSAASKMKTYKRSARRRNNYLKKRKALGIIKIKFGVKFTEEAIKDKTISNLYEASYGCRCYFCQGGGKRASDLRKEKALSQRYREYLREEEVDIID